MNRLLRIILLVSIAAVLAATANAQLRIRSHYQVTRAEVERAIAKALRTDNNATSSPDVALLSNVTASEVAPQLRVIAITTLPRSSPSHAGEQRLAVRLECQAAGVCMPFYAVVTAPFEAVLSRPGEAVPEPSASRSAVPQRLPVILHTGSHAALVLSDGKATLTIPVVSLENAAAGQSVRVRSDDRKHVYTARAVAPNRVEGSF